MTIIQIAFVQIAFLLMFFQKALQFSRKPVFHPID
jgi:hypothetical protein